MHCLFFEKGDSEAIESEKGDVGSKAFWQERNFFLYCLILYTVYTGTMPRQPRLDTPGALHHVMARGIERKRIFKNRFDKEDFLKRLAELCDAESLAVYAWVLIPNHFHLLVRTGSRPLASSMRKLLTGYVVNFNRRHKRYGHLFQNRYKSIICEDDPKQD